MLLDGPPFSNALQLKTYAYLNHLLNRSPSVGDPSAFTILLTHVPLHKPAGICTDAPHFTYFDEDDYWGRFREGGLREQNLLGEYISEYGILQGIFGMSGDREAPANGLGRKGVILNGHDHTGCDTLHYIRRISNNASASDSNTRDWTWEASRFTSPPANHTDTDEPSIREITLRSMMGEYGGNAGLLSLWFDDAPGVMEWKYEFAVCRFGLQHVWWAVHVVALIAILNVCLYAVSCVKLRTERRRAVGLVMLARRQRREESREKKQAYANLRSALIRWGDEKAQEVSKNHIYQMGREWLLSDEVITLVVRNYEAIHSVDDLKRVLGKTWEFDKYAGEMYEVISRTLGRDEKGETATIGASSQVDTGKYAARRR
ncbi:60S ribosomal protein L23A [Ascosphaera pollenicola]|nr:60S ribosomal protein L23A [Ascosphaera pollenicola]